MCGLSFHCWRKCSSFFKYDYRIPVQSKQEGEKKSKLVHIGLTITFLWIPLLLNIFNPFIANFTKWSTILKQFVSNSPTNCLSVFGHFVGLALKGLSKLRISDRDRLQAHPVRFEVSKTFNLLHASDLFLHPLKTSDNLVFWCFYWGKQTKYMWLYMLYIYIIYIWFFSIVKEETR